MNVDIDFDLKTAFTPHTTQYKWDLKDSFIKTAELALIPYCFVNVSLKFKALKVVVKWHAF